MIPTARRLHPTLPIFELEACGRSVLFTPGHLAVANKDEAEFLYRAWAAGRDVSGGFGHRIGVQLERNARLAIHKWQHQFESAFSPECLTLYLSNQCHLSCTYCYGAETRKNPLSIGNLEKLPVIDERVVDGAERIVARNCAEKGKPFHLVVHGGGEPTLHPDLLKRRVKSSRELASQFGIGWHGYISTSGVMPEKMARWLAGHFDLIGLSCDGPPDIQDQSRFRLDSRASSPYVERTARVIGESGGRFLVRSTILPQTVERQREIVDYLHKHLGARQIRFEPLYCPSGTNGPKGFTPDQAEWFVKHFLAAQEEARNLGCELTLSGVRLDTIHGPHCNFLKNVLHLTPDGLATACFLCTDGQGPRSSLLIIGGRNEKEGILELNRDRIASLRRKVMESRQKCRNCFNAYHCAGECPERCAAIDQEGEKPGHSPSHEQETRTFRCLVQRLLARTWILKAAEPLLGQSRITIPVRERNGSRAALGVFLKDAPSYLDADAIVHQGEALGSSFSIKRATLPLPVWAQRGFQHDGKEAWRQLSEAFPGEGDDRAISIYIHVPFCDRRCGFCNSHSIPLGKGNRQPEDDYLQALLEEIDAWARIDGLARRPVTTVHFGGGTPNYLSPEAFGRIIEHCRGRFGINPETEWALESTSSLLTHEHLKQLWLWGFRRLHVGVQTLEDPVRRTIGRREPASGVLEKLSRALQMGFVTSGDVMYGLPYQTLKGFISTLENLMAAGLHGFSVYGLQVTNLNRRFMERHNAANQDMLRQYAFFQVAEQCLVRGGYRKTHFTHFALRQDTNLYYSHPQRGEDLLALGPTADGFFGYYHYRHPGCKDYIAGMTTGRVSLEGGVWESPLERKLRPAAVALMSGKVPKELLCRLGIESLIEIWLDHALVKEGPDRQVLCLTANGSWFVNTMIGQVAERLAVDPSPLFESGDLI